MHKLIPFLILIAWALIQSNTCFAKTKIVLIAGKDSHGSSAHNWGDGVDLLSNALTNQSGLPIETSIFKGGWPTDPSIFNDAASVVVLSDGGGRHPINKHLKEFDALAEKWSWLGLCTLCSGGSQRFPWRYDEKMARRIF